MSSSLIIFIKNSNFDMKKYPSLKLAFFNEKDLRYTFFVNNEDVDNMIKLLNNDSNVLKYRISENIAFQFN